MFDDGTGEIILPQKGSTYAATRAAIDVQIATAKSYPRSLQQVGNNLRNWCTGDDQTAESCVYSLTRGSKTIRGPSIRFAEILTAAWGHLRIDARIVDEGKDFIVVRGECHDLQSNNVWAQDVTRRITGRNGARYDSDLIGVTMMAAASIAQRDSVLKCIPAFIWRPAFEACVTRIVGDVKTLNDRRIKAVGQFSVLGVSADQVFRKLAVSDINGVTADHLVDLIGMFNAIREGETSIEAVFGEQRITARSQGGSPLAAAEDEEDEDGKAPEPKEDKDARADGADRRQPKREPDSAGAPAPDGKGDAGGAGRDGDVGTQKTGTGRGGGRSAGRAKSETRTRGGGRQDKDADAVQPAGDAAAPAAAPAQSGPAEEEKPKAAPSQAAAQTTAPADKPKGRYLDPEGGTSPEALLRFWESDCDRCTTMDQLKTLAVSFGPKFDGKLNAEQEEMSRDTYDAAKERIEKAEAEQKRKAAAEAYERAQNGEDDPGPADGDGGQAAQDPPDELDQPVQRQSPMIERCSDMAPTDPTHLKIWHAVIEHLDEAGTKQEVLDRYAELERDGTIDKLPQDAALNARTVRFRVKNSKPS